MKYLVSFFIFLSFLNGSFAQTKNILMIVAPNNFRDEELFVPKKIFEENGYKVEVASLKTPDNKARGMGGTEINIDLFLEKVRPGKYDAVVIVGGQGAAGYWNNETVLNIIKDVRAAKKIIGAICIAPVCLANAGILNGKNATVFPSEAKRIQAQGAQYSNNEVVADDGIVTASGPFEAEEFAYKILEELQK
jgi:protease I